MRNYQFYENSNIYNFGIFLGLKMTSKSICLKNCIQPLEALKDVPIALKIYSLNQYRKFF